MAITSVSNHWEGSTGSGRGYSPSTGSEMYDTKYIVQTDDANDQVDTILKHFKHTGTLPYYGRTYSYANDQNSSIICVGLTAEKRESSRFIWDVTAHYESRSTASGEFPKGGDIEFLGNEFKPLEIDSFDTSISIPVEQARYVQGFRGKAHQAVNKAFGQFPITNSAFITYDPPVEREVDICVYRFTASYEIWDGPLWRKWRGVVNKSPVAFEHPGYRFRDEWLLRKARVQSITGRPDVGVRGTPYWRITFEFWVLPSPVFFEEQMRWTKVLVDRGIHRRAWVGDYDGNGGVYDENDFQDGMGRSEKILGPDGEPIDEPVLLDGNGQPLKEGEKPVWVEWQIYEEMELQPLLADILSR